MKQVLIYDPYLDTLGGGERYVLSFGKSLSALGFQVQIAWYDESIINLASARFDQDYSQIVTNPGAYYSLQSNSIFKKYLLAKHFDLIFWVSDGSLPFLFSKQSIVHFQVPFKKIGGNFLVNKIKSANIDKFIYNSLFTKSVLDKSLPKAKGLVLYPPVDLDKFQPGKKEKLIISVGRFFAPLNNKRQDVIIQAFSKLHSKQPEYQLVLLGGLVGMESQLNDLRAMAQGLPVTFIPNPDFATIQDYYARAQFFWHAAGFDVNEEKEPEKVEHFGITTVEAISAGCIPLVIAKGGQKEIIKSKELLCDTPEEIATKTIQIIEKNFVAEKIDISYYSLNSFREAVSKIIQ